MHKNRVGILGTAIFHGIMITIMIIFGFSTPLPLPAEEGILVNFGTDRTGFGEFEPKVSEQPAAVVSVPEESSVKPEEKTNLTQDFEEAPSIKEKKPEKKVVKQDVVPKETTKKENKAETTPTAEVTRKVNEHALYKGRSNRGDTSAGEGITQGEGNQGSISGSPDSDNYADILSQGSGGVTWNLTGRNPLSLPKPEYKYQVAGTVVVRINVDRSGKVTSAEAGVKGSNTTDARLLQAAREAALKTPFNNDPTAPIVQQGTLTYHFILQ